MYELVKDWPQLPNGHALGNPTGIGIDRNQNIFVFTRAGRPWTDPMPRSFISEKTILALDRDSGKILDSWGDNIFIMPHGLKVDKNNNIWVTDVGLHQVFKFNYKGELLMKLGEANVAGNDSTHFNLPTDIAIATDGSFYVSDGYCNSRVMKFSSSGKYLFEWGKKGNQPGEFNLPHGIEIDAKGNVYVADRENNRIQEFDAGGKFLQEWSSKSFGKMYSLTFDQTKRNLIAVDYIIINDTEPKGSDIILFDSIKNQVTQFGRSGLYDGPVCEYHGVAIDNEGNIYVGDILGNRIQKFKKMIKTFRQGAVGALLDEYEKAISELQQVLNDVSDEELIKVVDSKTTDANCKSIQTVLSHVVRSGYAYSIYIRELDSNNIDYPGSVFHLTVKDYQTDLNDFFIFTTETFENIQDNQLEQFGDGKKITTSWGEVYNIEQITEHAIVHVLRHRRQIEKFKIVLRGRN